MDQSICKAKTKVIIHFFPCLRNMLYTPAAVLASNPNASNCRFRFTTTESDPELYPKSNHIQDTEGNQALGFSDGGGCLQKSSVSTFYELQRGNRIGCLLVSGQQLVSGTCVRGGSGELDIVVGTELGLEHAAWALALHAPAACRWECRSPRGGNKHPQLFSALTAFIL